MPVVLPPESRQVYRWWKQMHEVRDWIRVTEPVTMPTGRLGWQVKSTAMRLSPERVQAWCQLNGVALEPWQLASIELVDEVYVRIKNDPPPPAVVATAEGLRSMFRMLAGKKK